MSALYAMITVCNDLAHLNKPYQSLCNPATPITSYLFGDDLNKQVDDLTKANKIGHKVQGPSTKPRYHPYGSSSGARGRGYRQNYLGRGRGSNYTPGARKGPFLHWTKKWIYEGTQSTAKV